MDLCGFVHLWDPYMPIWDDVVGCDMWFCMLYFGNATAEWKPCPWGQRPSIRETGPSPPRFPAGNLVATKTGTSVRSGVSWRSEEEIVRQKMAQRGVFGFTMDLPWFTFTGRNQIVQNTSECWLHRRWINTIIHGSGNNSWEVRFECNARSARKSYKETGWIRPEPSESTIFKEIVTRERKYYADGRCEPFYFQPVKSTLQLFFFVAWCRSSPMDSSIECMYVWNIYIYMYIYVYYIYMHIYIYMYCWVADIRWLVGT